ncbi:hypothetical protein LSH36_3g05096 [Paralvinella palmiformis]|uniref:Uncharacterized protein n=1 Tax=Paralvinella palmiformis TaxID=53620 RepID=A0AAD9KGF3_9ANNE|nr:hypothetical protein LSH36_3g05096 [Paralvinella palmiformis]
MDTYNKTTSYQDTYFRSPHMVVIVLVPILLALLTVLYCLVCTFNSAFLCCHFVQTKGNSSQHDYMVGSTNIHVWIVFLEISNTLSTEEAELDRQHHLVTH